MDHAIASHFVRAVRPWLPVRCRRRLAIHGVNDFHSPGGCNPSSPPDAQQPGKPPSPRRISSRGHPLPNRRSGRMNLLTLSARASEDPPHILLTSSAIVPDRNAASRLHRWCTGSRPALPGPTGAVDRHTTRTDVHTRMVSTDIAETRNVHSQEALAPAYRDPERRKPGACSPARRGSRP